MTAPHSLTVPPRVLTVAHDAGGARALIPVAELLRQRGAHVEAIVAGPAATLWPAECREVPAVVVRDEITVAGAAELLASPLDLDVAVPGGPEIVVTADGRAAGVPASGTTSQCVDVVVTAAGLYNRIEHTFRLAARQQGIRTVAVLDSWLNYAERFTRRSGCATSGEAAGSMSADEWCPPDAVCVMDELSRSAIVAAGLAPDRVIVTGPPNLERAVALCRSIIAGQRDEWRREVGAGVDDLVLAFFSEPFITGPGGAHFDGPGALVGPDGESLYGYTAVDTLVAVLDAIEAAGGDGGRHVRVVVKPHPAEWAEPLRSIAAKPREPWLHVTVRDDGPAARWIAVADGVVGMMSMALLEAAVAGVPTLSVQIGLGESGAENPCMASVLGHVETVVEKTELVEAVRRLVRHAGDVPAHVWRDRGRPALAHRGGAEPAPGRPNTLPVEGAAMRVADVVWPERWR